jgi:hypothetical protein
LTLLITGAFCTDVVGSEMCWPMLLALFVPIKMGGQSCEYLCTESIATYFTASLKNMFLKGF